jgi:hypothetical protein
MPDQPWAIRDTPAGVVIDLAQPRMKIDRRERELAPADETQLANSAAPKGSFGDRRQFATHAAPAPVNVHSAD